MAEASENQELGGHTIGVAIAIPNPYAAELQTRRRSFGDPMADAIPPHITLLPPTEIDGANVGDITKHLHSVAEVAHPFEVFLRGSATFRPVSPVVFVALASGIAECEMLARSVCSGPLTVELHYPYHPHVTVAHNLSDDALDLAFADMAGFEAAFQVESFWLYEHQDDGEWVQRHIFPLGTR